MTVDPDNLAEVLVKLSSLGDVSVGMMGTIGPRGWYASIKLPAPAGCEAAVRSSYDHKRPEAAVQQLVDRLEALRGQSVAEQSANPKLKLVASK